jgi:hypothetical protein
MSSNNDEEGYIEPFADHIYQPVQTNTTEDDMPASTASGRHHSIVDPSTLNYLTKVQVLTPLTILLNVASLAVCSILTKPNLGQINHKYVTQFTPNAAFVLGFWAVLFLLQVGFAILLVLGQKEFTKVGTPRLSSFEGSLTSSSLSQLTLANGVGMRLALANILLGVWAITWVVDSFGSFVAGLVLLSTIGVFLLVTALLLAIKYPPGSSRPLDWLFIHVPIKMFLVITLQLDIPQQLFMTLGVHGEHHKESLRAIWPSFGIIAGTGALSAIWIFATMDFVWAASGMFLYFALLFSNELPIHHRKPEMIAALVLAIVLQGVAIVGSVLYYWLAKFNDEGRVALGRNPQEEAEAARIEAEAEAAAATARARSFASNGENSADPSVVEEGHSGNNVEVTRKLGSP